MKNLLTSIVVLAALFLMGCGSVESASAGSGPVEISCASVESDQLCSGYEGSPGVWYSGDIALQDIVYLNFTIRNNSQAMATVRAIATVTISGCGVYSYAFQMVDIEPGRDMNISHLIWNHRCGSPGTQTATIDLMEAPLLDPVIFPNPWEYPRTAVIEMITIQWKNIQ